MYLNGSRFITCTKRCAKHLQREDAAAEQDGDDADALEQEADLDDPEGHRAEAVEDQEVQRHRQHQGHQEDQDAPELQRNAPESVQPDQHDHQDGQDHRQAGQLLAEEAGQPVGEIAQRLHQELAELAVLDVVHDLVLEPGAHDARHQPGQEGVGDHLAVGVAVDHRAG